jgi:hypothetical protein
MGILLYILIGFLSLFLLIVIIGFLSPRNVKVTRSLKMKSSPEAAFGQMVDLKAFVANWSPWAEKDPEAINTFSGAEQGVGAVFEWKGHPKKVGQGRMEVTSVKPYTEVLSSLEFTGRGKATAVFHIEDLGNGEILVQWGFEADNGMNPAARIFGRFMDKLMGPDFEHGLKKLQNTIEKN